MAESNRKSAVEDPEEEEDRDVTVAEYELLAELSMDIVVEEFQNGPFVIDYNDLTVQNILVDDKFNITGILDFPSTTVPLASLCVFPWLFSDNLADLVTDRDAYRDVFVNQECHYSSSALQSCELRRELMESATNLYKDYYVLGGTQGAHVYGTKLGSKTGGCLTKAPADWIIGKV
ncbi:hypothetical protein PENDEC_c002G04149 [Penicillium decumbens]|uniref:Aminoglycoside phosphotransferase domain-containing protein n=1 Tax=Penicillium decumbens TaxID=69771 RepID=A0A1V6PKM2_PENDC|nr:hypothetical protein PENDEC_c002G04149 [Penicillium decumbens]